MLVGLYLLSWSKRPLSMYTSVSHKTIPHTHAPLLAQKTMPREQGPVAPELRKFRRNRNSGMSVFKTVFQSFSRLGAASELRNTHGNTGTSEIPVTAELRFRRIAQPSAYQGLPGRRVGRAVSLDRLVIHGKSVV